MCAFLYPSFIFLSSGLYPSISCECFILAYVHFKCRPYNEYHKSLASQASTVQYTNNMELWLCSVFNVCVCVCKVVILSLAVTSGKWSQSAVCAHGGGV